MKIVIDKEVEIAKLAGMLENLTDDKDKQSVRFAINVIEGFEEKPKGEWIPVSERLPERHKEVIVTDIETSDTYQSQYIGNGYWECDNGILKNRIIAWMPLPEPYKKEAENDSRKRKENQ